MPIKLEWWLSATSGAYRVTDLVIDGTSMVLSYRSEFLTIIERVGGMLAQLLTRLRPASAAADV